MILSKTKMRESLPKRTEPFVKEAVKGTMKVMNGKL